MTAFLSRKISSLLVSSVRVRHHTFGGLVLSVLQMASMGVGRHSKTGKAITCTKDTLTRSDVSQPQYFVLGGSVTNDQLSMTPEAQVPALDGSKYLQHIG